MSKPKAQQIPGNKSSGTCPDMQKITYRVLTSKRNQYFVVQKNPGSTPGEQSLALGLGSTAALQVLLSLQ
jgi:hypothetical protein